MPVDEATQPPQLPTSSLDAATARELVVGTLDGRSWNDWLQGYFHAYPPDADLHRVAAKVLTKRLSEVDEDGKRLPRHGSRGRPWRNRRRATTW